MKTMRFTLTEDHLKLFRQMNVGWQECEYGAPEIDPKRPYGNGDVEADIIATLGWPWDRGEYEEPPKSLRQRAAAIHKEMETALQVVLSSCSFEPGVYVSEEWGRNDWHREAEKVEVPE
jgi:hypothetical protein